MRRPSGCRTGAAHHDDNRGFAVHDDNDGGAWAAQQHGVARAARGTGAGAAELHGLIYARSDERPPRGWSVREVDCIARPERRGRRD
jgi:hypothetical protein